MKKINANINEIEENALNVKVQVFANIKGEDTIVWNVMVVKYASTNG